MELRGRSKGHTVTGDGDKPVGASTALNESVGTSSDERRVGYTSLCESEFA